MAKLMRGPSQARVLFARIGWMRFYNGPVPGDERPIGGGKFNRRAIGHEVYNFRVTQSRLYGYFEPSMRSHAIALERIDPIAANADQLAHVLVVFVAPRPGDRQFIVGWYRDATVLRFESRRSPGKPAGYGHFCYASANNCILLPDEKRRHKIAAGRGAFGQANVCYPLNPDGSRKQFAWIRQALEFIASYEATNLLMRPEADAETESTIAVEAALARSKGQGFARTPAERKAIEDRAMAAAKRHFRKHGFTVEDVSRYCPYDLRCRRKSQELHVEVKGTVTDGAAVVLTYNEVAHAQSKLNNCALFILHSIRLHRGKAIGGSQRVVLPWQINTRQLRPINYTYTFSTHISQPPRRKT